MRYQGILIDALNLLYRVRNEKVNPTLVASRYVYKNLVVRYLTFVEQLRDNYLTEDGSIFLLLDPSPNTHDYSKSYRNMGRKAIYSHYKENRSKESKEFYNTFDLIKYYYLTNTSMFASVQIQNKEADDLVKPVMDAHFNESDRLLMVTNDYDWARYLNETVDWLPKLSEEPATVQDFIDTKGYKPSESSVLLYKAIFGDASDNIPSLLTENKDNVQEMIEMLQEEALDTKTLLTRTYHTKNLESSKILKAVHENEKQFRINVQLIDAQPISEKHIQAATCFGRSSEIVTDAIETAIGLRKEKREFVFGNIKHKA